MPIDDVNIFIQRFISEFSALAIPVFFTVSGFLFFLGLNDFHGIATKWRKRISSLFVPFLCWNALEIIFWSSIYVLVPPLREQLFNTFGITFSLQWILERMTVSPIVGQFWYIRTLILLMLLSPIMILVYKFRILSLFVLILLMKFWIPVDCRLLSTEGLFCFYLGGLIGFNQWHKGIHLHKYFWVSLPVIIGLICIGIFYIGKFTTWHIRILLSIIFFIQLSLYLANYDTIMKKVCNLNNYSFVIYALHGNLISAITIILACYLPHTPIFSFLAYCISVISTVTVAILFAVTMKKVCPKLYPAFTGGRG